MNDIQIDAAVGKRSISLAVVVPWCLAGAFAAVAGWLAVKQYAPHLLEGAKAVALSEVQNTVRAGLKDPESARFSDVRISADGKYACGEVNAKNAMGGYVGSVGFLLQLSTKRVELMPQERAGLNSLERLEVVQKQIKFVEDSMRLCDKAPPS